MVSKSKRFWTVVASIAGAAVLTFVTGAWAYSNGIERRLSSCEASQIGTEDSIKVIRDDVRELRSMQMAMWEDLAGRIDKGR